MLTYIIRRLALMIPTVFGIMLISFAIVQFAPGGPVERMLNELQGEGGGGATERISGSSTDFSAASQSSGILAYRGTQGLEEKFIEEFKKRYGLDKPPLEQFGLMISNYLTLDFGNSFFRDQPVIDLIASKLPVSISLGIWLTIISYGISIPLGIAKAVHDGSRFDVATSSVVVIAYAVPGFLFAILLITLFAGGSFFTIFPLKGLISEDWESLSWPAKIADYLWHLILPVIALSLSSFASSTLLTKNSFLDEIKKQYTYTARSKGLTEKRVLYGHVFRNAMLIIIAGFPGAFIGAFFTGSLLIETIFSLDGLGLLSYEAIVGRDYPIVFASLFIFSSLGLIVGLLSDLTYIWIDPRIDFEKRDA